MEKHEKEFRWDELNEFQKEGVVVAHKTLTSDVTRLLRLFELGRPQVVIGYHGAIMTYCRIAAPSVDVMKLIIRKYL